MISTGTPPSNIPVITPPEAVPLRKQQTRMNYELYLTRSIVN
jgi:hypothetical protein